MDKKRVFMWIGVGVVVIAFIAILMNSNPQPLPQVTAPSTNNVASFVPKGQVTPGFPKELILDKDASIGSSYSVKYDGGANQFTAQWMTQTSMEALFTAYQNYLPANQWKITNTMVYKGAKGLHAQNSGASVGVSIQDRGTSRIVTVTYVSQ